MTFHLSREQLHRLVWSMPMQRLAKQVGISDVAIAKHCRKLGIPVPQRGYWNKLNAGHKVVRIELPPRDLGTHNQVSMSGKLTSELRALIEDRQDEDDSGPELEVLTARFRKRLGRVSAPRDFASPHHDIKKLLDKDEEYRRKMATERWYFSKPKFDTPFERRRLRILDGIFRAVARVGGSGWIRGEDARELAIYIGDHSVGFTLDRPVTRRGRQAVSTGGPDQLCIELTHNNPPAGVRVRWQDEEGAKLESQLTDILVGMAVASEHFHRQRAEQMRAWERKRREEEEREAQKRREEAERKERERIVALKKAKVDALKSDAAAWSQAQEIRAYVAAIREDCNDFDPERLEEWSRWALTEADSLDPLTSGRARTRLSESDEP